MHNFQGQPITGLKQRINLSLELRNGNMASPSVRRTQVMHADTLSALESALLLGSFLTLAASLASLTAL